MNQNQGDEQNSHPAQGWDQAQPQQPQGVQYAEAQKSYQSVGGWLMFFVIGFGISTVFYIDAFFKALAGLVSGEGGGAAAGAIFGLPIAALSMAALVFICMQKKLGRSFAFAALAVMALFDFTNEVVSLAAKDGSAAEIIADGGSVFYGLIGNGLIALYFAVSKRVKATLVK